MATYYVDEAAFEIEDGAFDDRTVHVLQAPEASAHDVGILLSRSPLAAGSTLREHVLRHCDHEARAFRAYKRLDSRELDVDGAAVAKTMIASPATTEATPRAGATSASSACPRRRHRTTSPTPTAAS